MNTETATLLVVSYREFLRDFQYILGEASRRYSILTATNTPDALRLFKKSMPDLILAAYVLADNQQLLKEIRTLPAGEEIPFIIISSSFDEEVHSDLGKQVLVDIDEEKVEATVTRLPFIDNREVVWSGLLDG